MIVVSFKVTSKPERVDELAASFANVVVASRRLDGVVAFDVAQAVDDTATFIATEVFADAGARAAQESLPEVAEVMSILKNGAIVGPPTVAAYEATAL